MKRQTHPVSKETLREEGAADPPRDAAHDRHLRLGPLRPRRSRWPRSSWPVLPLHDVVPTMPQWPARDRFILGKGHAAERVFPCWPTSVSFRRRARHLHALQLLLGDHPDMKKVPGFDFSSGSIGHGLSVSVGIALGSRRRRGLRSRSPRSWATASSDRGPDLGGGDLGGHRGLRHLLGIVDINRAGSDGDPQQDVGEVGLEQCAAEPAPVVEREPPAAGERRSRSGPTRPVLAACRRRSALPCRGAAPGPGRSLHPEELAAPVRAPSVWPTRAARSRPGRAGGRRTCRGRRRRRSPGPGPGRSAGARARPRAARAWGALPARSGGRRGARASIRSTTSGASTCSITMTAAPITPARSSSAERTIRSDRVPSGTARW